MGILAEFQAILRRLDLAVDDALRIEVADAVKAEMRTQVHERVYNAYEPAFPESRRMDSGGLSDITNYDARVESGHELVVENDTPMQHPNGSSLVEIVEEGRKSYHMPFPRPFVHEAEQEVNAGWALAQGLRRGGFAVTHRRG